MRLSYILWYNHHAKLCPYSYLTISRFLLWKMKQRLSSCCYAQMCLKVFSSQKLDTCVGGRDSVVILHNFCSLKKQNQPRSIAAFYTSLCKCLTFWTSRCCYDESQCLLFTSMSICLNWEAVTTAADLKHTQFGEAPVTCFLILISDPWEKGSLGSIPFFANCNSSHPYKWICVSAQIKWYFCV